MIESFHLHISPIVQRLSEDASSLVAAAGPSLNSNFVTALLGSLAGAYAGAIAAQRIVEKNKTREELLKELRTTNAAVMLAFTMCNAALALKKQHVGPMYEEFKKVQASLEAFEAERTAGGNRGADPFYFIADMRAFQTPTIPIETMRDLLFNKLSATGRSLSLLCAIDDAEKGLEQMVGLRLTLGEQIRKGVIPQKDLPYYYFGRRMPDGHTNNEYPDAVFGIYSCLDDLIFFSYLLCSDLTDHAKRLHARIPKQLRKAVPKPHEADFSSARASGLIPPDSQYESWIKGFVQHTVQPSKWIRDY